MNVKNQDHMHTNRLLDEKSPYLLQHAHNPVDWYPWSDEAFKKAKSLNRPVFLSIGYSTCHWCHVMERESFADEQVGQFLNQHFVAIKVDREERPDVDQIYMSACQALTGRGGWPLTVLLTPDKEPFFAGTYLPKRSRQGMMGLMELLEVVVERWEDDPGKLRQAARRITEALQEQRESPPAGTDVPQDAMHAVYTWLQSQYDPVYGGFGPAPKFPMPHHLLFLIRYSAVSDTTHALDMAEHTLKSMQRGGIYDHLGFGFSRYSTDEKWLVPHFEKMLYDNALLALSYAECFQCTGDSFYAGIVREIFTYILRDMTGDEGGFFSAEDADSEGIEGKFYVWKPEQVFHILGEDMGGKFCQWYDITPEGNFEKGYSILNRIHAHRPAEDEVHDRQGGQEGLAMARRRLWEVREEREHPYKDDKVLTFWNGLMIASMARAGHILGDDSYVHAAQRAMEFLWNHLRDEDGRWHVRYRQEERGPTAFLDDYAAVIWGLLELFSATHDPEYLRRAVLTQKEQDRLFLDADGGGYFFAGHDAQALFTRSKELYDGATPSGNSLAGLNLMRLFHLTGDAQWHDGYEGLLAAFAPKLNTFAAGSSFFVMSLALRYGENRQVVIVPGADWPQTMHGLAPVWQRYAPLTSVIIAHPEHREELTCLAPFTGSMEAVEGRTTFYVCQDFACQAPITRVDDFMAVMSQSTRDKD